MVKKKQTPVVYKREKDKIEIIGNPDDVKPIIWYDLLLNKLLQILRLFIFFKTSLTTVGSIIWEWIKNKYL